MMQMDNEPLAVRIVRATNRSLAVEIENVSRDLTLSEIEALPIFLERDEERGERRAMIKLDAMRGPLAPGERAQFSHRTRFAKDLPNGTDDPWEDAEEGNDLLILVTERSSRGHSYVLDLRFIVDNESQPRFQILRLGAGSGIEIST